MDNYNKVREDYIQARLKQRVNLMEKMEQNNFLIVTKSGGAGKGRSNYGKRKLDPPHDLRHHLWIDAVARKDENVHFLISLNPFETDSGSGNSHHLYDRIGVQVYLGNENWESSHRTAMIITKWSLPLSQEETDDFLHYLNNMVEWFQDWETICRQ